MTSGAQDGRRSSVLPSTLFWCLVGFVEDFHEVFGHKVRLLQRPIMALQVLQEAEEECVDTHVVHAEESVSYEVAAEHHRNNWHPVVVEGFRAEGGAWQQNPSREEKEGQNTDSCNHQELPKEQQQVSDFIEHHDPYYISHEQHESIFG